MTASVTPPKTEYLTISVYWATPGTHNDVFISRMTPPHSITATILRHYRHVSLASLHRLAQVASNLVSDKCGKVFPRGDGWMFQGHRPVNTPEVR